MSRIFITGSTDGLGRAAAVDLLDDGHEVVVHARSAERLAAVSELEDRGAVAVVGDLADPEQTRALADEVNRLGRMDAVIHNAGTMNGPGMLAVNVIAPYLLTALIERPKRLVYLSSSMHAGGRAELEGLDGRKPGASYSDAKLLVTVLAAAVARRWPQVQSHAVDPGWVPTKMGGPSASDDLRLGHLTQAWLAASDEVETLASGGYWHHRRRETPHAAVADEDFQERLLRALEQHTGVSLPEG